MKPPARVWVPTVQQMARFTMGETAPAGAIVDLDLNSGLLVHARMTGPQAGGTQAQVPAEPPPGMFLRALVQAWGGHAMGLAGQLRGQGGEEAAYLSGLSEAWAGAASQLAQVLDMMGVATGPGVDPDPEDGTGED